MHEFRCPKCGHTVKIMKSSSDNSSPLCCEESCGDIQMILSTLILCGGGSDVYSKKEGG